MGGAEGPRSRLRLRSLVERDGRPTSDRSVRFSLWTSRGLTLFGKVLSVIALVLIALILSQVGR